MAVSITVNASQLQGATAQLRAVAQVLGRPQPLLKVWAVELLKDVQQTFRTGGRPAWTPLKPSTLAAKRVGRGSKRSTAQPLQSLARTFDAMATDREAVVFSRSPVAGYHERGTRGPYEIRPRNAKVLAIPVGPFTLAGLGRSAPTGRGSFTFVPAPGQRTPRRFQGRAGKAAVPFKDVIFRPKVTHPGLPARPMLPTVERIGPVLQRAGEAFLAHIAQRAR